MVQVLRTHSMDYPAIVLVMDTVHPVAAIACGHCRTREYKRKHGGSDNSRFRHASLLLVSGNAMTKRGSYGRFPVLVPKRYLILRRQTALLQSRMDAPQ